MSKKMAKTWSKKKKAEMEDIVIRKSVKGKYDHLTFGGHETCTNCLEGQCKSWHNYCPMCGQKLEIRFKSGYQTKIE